MPGPVDLAELARERMARESARKRQRSISPPAPRSPRKAPKLDASTVSLPSGARLTSFSSVVQNDQQTRKSEAANSANQRLSTLNTLESAQRSTEHKCESQTEALRPGDVIYPQGIVRKTWAFGHVRDGNDIKLEEVLEPNTLRTAVLSAFQWDTDWVLSKLKVPPNNGTTRCVFIMQGKESSLRTKMLAETEPVRSWLRLCFPPMEGQTHCMHSKLMLLFHHKKLRVAIPTANLLNFDWGETGVMENSVFMIDLPRLPEGSTQPDSLTPFGKELMFFLQKQGLDQGVRDALLDFDFSATHSMAFVHSVGGISFGTEAERTGVTGLGRAVDMLGLTAEDVHIDFAASSIGSLNNDFLRTVHAGARGEDVFRHAANNTSKRTTSFFQQSSQSDHSIRDKIRIYFPTHDTVAASTAGAAGTICLSRKWFEAMTFPRRCFRDYVSTRPGLLSHNKLLYARGVSGDKRKIAWAYVGSANLSESAWGKLVFDKKDKAWRINCRNWECGVLLPVANETPVSTAAGDGGALAARDVGGSKFTEHDLLPMTVFDGIVKPPFIVPGSEFGGKEPWYFQER